MQDPERDIPVVGREYYENQREVPLEVILPYAGKFVAWSLDGKTILAGGDTIEEVDQKLIAAGIDPSRVVGGYIDEPGVSYLG
jgi:hypothetical protein